MALRIAPIDNSSWLAPAALAARLRASEGENLGQGLAHGAAAATAGITQRRDKATADARWNQQFGLQQQEFGFRQQEHQDALAQNDFQNDVTSRHLLDAQDKQLAMQAAGLQLVPGFDQTPAWQQNAAERAKVKSSMDAIDSRLLNHRVRQAATGGSPGGTTAAPADIPDAWAANQATEDASWAKVKAIRDAQMAPMPPQERLPGAPVAATGPFGMPVAPTSPVQGAAPVAAAAGPDTTGLDPEQAGLLRQHASLLSDSLQHQRLVESLKMIAQSGGVAPVPMVKEEARLSNDLAIRQAAFATRQKNYDEGRAIAKAQEITQGNQRANEAARTHSDLVETLGALQNHSPEVVDLMQERLAKGIDTEDRVLGKAKDMLAAATQQRTADLTEQRQQHRIATEQKNRLEMARVNMAAHATLQTHRYDLYHRYPDAADPVKLQDLALSNLKHERNAVMDRLDPRKFPPGDDLDAYNKQKETLIGRVDAIDTQMREAEAEKYRLSAIPKEARPSTAAYLESVPSGSGAPVGSPQDEQFWHSTPRDDGAAPAYPDWVHKDMRKKWDALTPAQKAEAERQNKMRSGI